MTTKVITAMTLGIVVTMNALISQAEEVTLRDLKQRYLDKNVVISSEIVSDSPMQNGQSTLFNWCSVKPDNNGKHKENLYKPCLYPDVPYTDQGAKGKVVSIEVVDLLGTRTDRTSDIFGDPLTENNPINPYVDVFVRLEDGRLVMTRGYEKSINLLLGSDLDEIRPEIISQLDSVIGKTLYTIHSSEIYSPTATFPELADIKKHQTYILKGIPNLTPLKIIKAKYFENYNAIVTKVSFLNDQVGLIYSKIPRQSFNKIKNSFIDVVRAGAGVLAGMGKLTDREIAAIKQGNIFRGMSADAVFYSWGLQDSENDYGSAGKQLIYGSQIVYLKDDVVTDFQELGK